ncbi:hypothetical protein B0H34DRAFT_863080 [Crassisporium funariophilum]|nr:hypothetical protein B0H34DRAFT_863080 [Crassisporium funariophilum]
MGVRWTTDEQLAFLEGKRPLFIEARASKKLDKFYTTTTAEWFKVFPERKAQFPQKPDDELLTAEEQAVVKTGQLKDWFGWNGDGGSRRTTGNNREASGFVKALKEQETKSSERAPQRVEIYQKICAEKVESIQDQRCKEVGAKTSGEILKVQREVARELLPSEGSEIQAAIDKEIAEWKEKQKEQTVVDWEGADTSNRTPEQYQAAINSLPMVLVKALQACANASGWVIMGAAAGPVPMDNGRVFVRDFYVGPKTPAGYDFHQSYAGFDRLVLKPFSEHALNCFPIEVRAARALKPKTSEFGTEVIDPQQVAAGDRVLHQEASNPPGSAGDWDDDQEDSRDLEDAYRFSAQREVTCQVLGTAQPQTLPSAPVPPAPACAINSILGADEQIEHQHSSANTLGSITPPTSSQGPNHPASTVPGGPNEPIETALARMDPLVAHGGLVPIETMSPIPPTSIGIPLDPVLLAWSSAQREVTRQVLGTAQPQTLPSAPVPPAPACAINSILGADEQIEHQRSSANTLGSIAPPTSSQGPNHPASTVPGGPNEPIEMAFARMDPLVAHGGLVPIETMSPIPPTSIGIPLDPVLELSSTLATTTVVPAVRVSTSRGFILPTLTPISTQVPSNPTNSASDYTIHGARITDNPSPAQEIPTHPCPRPVANTANSTWTLTASSRGNQVPATTNPGTQPQHPTINTASDRENAVPSKTARKRKQPTEREEEVDDRALADRRARRSIHAPTRFDKTPEKRPGDQATTKKGKKKTKA